VSDSCRLASTRRPSMVPTGYPKRLASGKIN
jgi:hypothetical protein